VGNRPDPTAQVTATHFGSPFDEHHAELAVAGQAVVGECLVAGLEHMQRQFATGEQHVREGNIGSRRAESIQPA